MLERERHAFQRRAHVARIFDPPVEHLHADCHQSAPPSVGSGSSRPRSYRARSYRAERSFSMLRLSSREYAGLINRPRSIRPKMMPMRMMFATNIAPANFQLVG